MAMADPVGGESIRFSPTLNTTSLGALMDAASRGFVEKEHCGEVLAAPCLPHAVLCPCSFPSLPADRLAATKYVTQLQPAIDVGALAAVEEGGSTPHAPLRKENATLLQFYKTGMLAAPAPLAHRCARVALQRLLMDTITPRGRLASAVAALLPPASPDALLAALGAFVHNTTTRTHIPVERGLPAATTSEPPPLLLCNAQVALVAAAKREWGACVPPRGSAAPLAPQPAAARATLRRYTEATLGHCLTVTSAALALLADPFAHAEESAAPTPLNLSDALMSTVVGEVLPGLAAALESVHHPGVAEGAATPLAAALFLQLAAVCNQLPDVRAAAAAFALEEAGSQAEQLCKLPLGGETGEVVPPLQGNKLLEVLRSVGGLVGHLCALLAAGVPVGEEEEVASPWLSCALFSGGLPPARAPRGADALYPSWKEALSALPTTAAATPASPAAPAATPPPTTAACDAFIASIIDVDLEDSKLGDATPVTVRGKVLHDWLESKTKYTNSRARQRAHKSLRLPTEVAFLAAALRHTGLWVEADAALVDLDERGVATGELAPTAALAAVWDKVKELRRWLKDERTAMDRVATASADGRAEAPTAGAGAAPSESKADPESKYDDSESKLGEAAGVAPAAPPLRRAPVHAHRSFADLELQLQRRMAFLCHLAPAAAPPPLPSLLPLSADAREGYNRRESGAPRMDMAWYGDAVGRAVDRGDGADDVKAHLYAVTLYAREGWAADPSVLTRFLHLRNVRASGRALALSALEACVSAAPPPFVARDVLLPLRGALRGCTLAQVRRACGMDPIRFEEALAIPHHPLRFIRGAHATALTPVCEAYTDLLAAATPLLATAHAANDLWTAQAVLSLLALDWRAADATLLETCGVLPALRALCTLEQHAKGVRSALNTAFAASMGGLAADGGHWRPWAYDHALTLFLGGDLPREELVEHIKAGAGAKGAPPPWGDADPSDLPDASLLLHFQAFLSDSRPALEPSVDGGWDQAAGALPDANNPDLLAFAACVALPGRANVNQAAIRRAAWAALGCVSTVSCLAAPRQALHNAAEFYVQDLKVGVHRLYATRARPRDPTEDDLVEEMVSEALFDCDHRALYAALVDRLRALLSLCGLGVVSDRLLHPASVLYCTALYLECPPPAKPVLLRLLRPLYAHVAAQAVGASMRLAEEHMEKVANGWMPLPRLLAQVGDASREASPDRNADTLRFPAAVLGELASTRALLVAGDPAADDDHHFLATASGVGVGHTCLWLDADAGNLLRHLHGAAHDDTMWTFAITTTLIQDITQAKGAVVDGGRGDGALPRGSPADCATLARASAALYILGGGTNVLRPGAHVMVGDHRSAARRFKPKSALRRSRPSSKGSKFVNAALVHALAGAGDSEGVVLRYARGDATALVLFGSVTDSHPTTMDATLLLPVDDVPPSTRGVAAGGRFVDMLRKLVQISPTGGAAPAAAPSTAGAGAGRAPSMDRAIIGSVGAAELWRLELRQAALLVVLKLFEQAEAVRADFVQGALAKHLLPALFDAALTPVPDPGFPNQELLRYKAEVLRERQLEAGPHRCFALPAADPRAVASRRSPIAPPANDDPDRARWDQARALQTASGGRTLRQCFYALLKNGDSSADALMWLVGHDPDAEISAEMEAASRAAVSGPDAFADANVVERLRVQQPLMAGANDDHDVAADAKVVVDRNVMPPEMALVGRADAGPRLPPRSLVVVTKGAADVAACGSRGRCAVYLGRAASPPASSVVRVYDGNTLAHYDAVVPDSRLHVVREVFGEDVALGATMLHALLGAALNAVSSHVARRCVTSVLLAWPSNVRCTSRALGGIDRLISLAKIVSAGEGIFSNPDDLAQDDAGDAGRSSSLVDALSQRIAWLVMQETVPPAWEGFTWACPTCTVVNDGVAENCAVCMTGRPRLEVDPVKLSTSLVNDCTTSILDSSGGFGGTRDIKAFQTRHPVAPGAHHRGDMSIPGASCLWVSFDDECHLEVAPGTHNSRTELAFFTDAALTQCVGRFAGQPHAFTPFIVPAPTLFFTFRFDQRDAPCWGVRFTVSKLSGLWLEEDRVLTEPSLEWGCWLLEFLLYYGGGEQLAALPQGAVHNNRLVSALVRYLRTPAVPFKHRVVPLLTQLLSRPDLFSTTDPPRLDVILGGIKDACVASRNCIKSRGSPFLPRLLQQLFELLATARTSMNLVRAAAPRRPLSYPECVFRPGEAPGAWVPPLVIALHPQLISEMTESVALEELRLVLLSMGHGTRLPDHWMCRAIMYAFEFPDTSLVSLDALAQFHRASALFTPDHDEALIALASNKAKKLLKSVIELPPSKLALTEADASSFPVLLDFVGHAEALSLPTVVLDKDKLLQLRFSVLVVVNRLLYGCIEMVDTVPGGGAWNLGHMLRAWSHLVFVETKDHIISEAVERSWATGTFGSTVKVDNRRAMQSTEAGFVDPSRSTCMFAQLHQLLRGVAPWKFRCRLTDKDLLFAVQYVGLSGQADDGLDWGGLYRDLIQRVVEDLFSQPPHISLFVLTPNARAAPDTHAGREDLFLPNAAHTSAYPLSMFEFTGKLMGVSLRTKAFLGFELAGFVWKRLVGQAVTLDDLNDVDTAAAGCLTRMRDFDPTAGAAAFEDAFNAPKFVVANAAGDRVELVPGGADIAVTPGNVHQYVDMAVSTRLGEFDRQIAAIHRGLVAVVPKRAIQLCTWKDLQQRVCGDSEIDLDVLKRNTVYDSGGVYNDRHPTIRLFWKVVAEFTNEQRLNLIRFTWGRARLPKGEWPTSTSGRKVQFQILPKSGGNRPMPVAHTCFFQLELPQYTSEAVMRQRLVAAITYGLGSFLIR